MPLGARTDTWSLVGVVFFGGPAVILAWALFPYSCFRACANVDELTDADAVIESQGIAHDQVTQKLGLDLERYECPLSIVRAAGAGYVKRGSTLEELEKRGLHRDKPSETKGAAANEPRLVRPAVEAVEDQI